MRTILTSPSAAAAAGSRPSEPELTKRIIDDLGEAIGALRCAGSERLVRAGVSMTHLHLMWMIQRHGELSMTRLAEMLDVSLSNATGLIDRMEERGLIERSRVPDDRRVVRVGLSAHGRELLAEIDVIRGDMAQTVLRHLTATQLDALMATVADIRGALQAARDAGELADSEDVMTHHGHHHLTHA